MLHTGGTPQRIHQRCRQVHPRSQRQTPHRRTKKREMELVLRHLIFLPRENPVPNKEGKEVRQTHAQKSTRKAHARIAGQIPGIAPGITPSESKSQSDQNASHSNLTPTRRSPLNVVRRPPPSLTANLHTKSCRKNLISPLIFLFSDMASIQTRRRSNIKK